MDFRKDINGLRALAVLAVVLFHFKVFGFGGGFVGVDVFFVISGYLMTGIIFRRLDRDEFSIIGFYLDRGRRIIPALLIVCLALLCLGWFLLPPVEYTALGKYAAASSAFVSNILFARENGYFDQASRSKWLLHTWSLSVEWQFYIFYPLVILVLKKYFPRRAVCLQLGALAILSFGMSMIVTRAWPSWAFYMLPTRAWEMLAGGLVYLFPFKVTRPTGRIVAISGFALIVASIFFVSDQDMWPGWLAAFPVLGTCLVIAANQEDLVLTSNGPFQFLGRISYSVYLWHWPVVVTAGYFGGGNTWPVQIGGIIISLLLGYFSYRFIERAIGRASLIVKGRRPFAELAGATLAIGVFGSAAFASHGMPSRMTDSFNESTKNLVMPTIRNGWCFYDVDTMKNLSIGAARPKCLIGEKKAKISGLLFGDSYAGQYDPFWDAIGKSMGIEINSVSTNWCFPTSKRTDFTEPSHTRAYAQCLANREYLDAHISDFDFVILAGQWGRIYDQGKFQGVLDEIGLAAARNKLVIVMAAPTTFDADIASKYETSILLGRKFNIADYGKGADEYTRRANHDLANFAAKFVNVIYISRASMFNVMGVPSDITKDGIPYSWDGLHISVYGSSSAAASFEETDTYKALAEKVSLLRAGGAGVLGRHPEVSAHQ